MVEQISCGFAALILTLPVNPSEAHEATQDYAARSIPLPGAVGPVLLDHVVCDRVDARIWVPGSNTGNVYVISEDTGKVSVVPGFKIGEVELEGEKAVMGPTAVTLGDDVVYVGDRADSTLCVIDPRTLKNENCVSVKQRSDLADSGPHAVAYVAATHEVWVTTGPAKSIQIFDVADAKHPKWKTEIPLEAGSEGYAVDNKRGRFYTNLDEVGRTLAIDVRSHKVVASWNLDSHDVQGIALDAARGFIFVACNDHVVSLDANRENKIIDSIATGAGLDDIDFAGDQSTLYAAASVTATLAMISVDYNGKFRLKELLPTTKGARGVIVGKANKAYLIDPAEGRVLELTHK